MCCPIGWWEEEGGRCYGNVRHTAYYYKYYMTFVLNRPAQLLLYHFIVISHIMIPITRSDPFLSYNSIDKTFLVFIFVLLDASNASTVSSVINCLLRNPCPGISYDYRVIGFKNNVSLRSSKFFL